MLTVAAPSAALSSSLALVVADGPLLRICMPCRCVSPASAGAGGVGAALEPPRGRLRLAGAADWDAAQIAAVHERAERAERLAHRRAWRRWRNAHRVVQRLPLLPNGLTAPSGTVVAAWRAVESVAADCAARKLPGWDWAAEIAFAAGRVAELTVRLGNRADRRRERDERKRAGGPGADSPQGQPSFGMRFER